MNDHWPSEVGRNVLVMILSLTGPATDLKFLWSHGSKFAATKIGNKKKKRPRVRRGLQIDASQTL